MLRRPIARSSEVPSFLDFRVVGSLTAAKLAATLTAAAVQLAAARTLGSHQFGIYAAVLALATPLASVATLGFQQTLLRFGARAVACGDRRSLKNLTTYAAFLTLLSGSGLAYLLHACALVPFASDEQMSLLGGLLVPLGASSLVLASLLRVLERPLAAILLEPLCRMTTIAIMLWTSAIVPYHPHAVHLLFATSVGLLVSVVFASTVARKAFRSVVERSSITVSNGVLFRATAYAFIILATNAFATRSVAALLGHVLEPDQFGPYALASRFAELLGLPLWCVVLIAAPRFAASGGGNAPVAALLARSRLLATVLSVGPVTATVVFADGLLAMVGPDYTVATTVLQLFSVKVLALAAIGPSLAALTMLGGERTAAWLTTVAGGAALAAVVPVAARWGATGGAAVQSLADVVVASGALIALHHRLRRRAILARRNDGAETTE
jgi:O-antigen/teichoic acid export membrane protein